MEKENIKFCYLKDIKKVTSKIYTTNNEKIIVNNSNKNNLVIFKIKFDSKYNPYILYIKDYKNNDFKNNDFLKFNYLFSLNELYFSFIWVENLSIKKESFLIQKSEKIFNKLIELLPFKNESEKDSYIDIKETFKFWDEWENINFKIAKRLKRKNK